MPNVKIFVDDSIWKNRKDAFTAVLEPIRELLCARLDVPTAACQLALIPVVGLTDQPQVNLELLIMPGPDRTQDMIRSLAGELQARLIDLAGSHAAIRIGTLDPLTYVSLK